MFEYNCKTCGKTVITGVIPSDGICDECRNSKPEEKSNFESNFERFWQHEDYRRYALLQMSLYIAGHQTASKTAEILHVDIRDVWKLAREQVGEDKSFLDLVKAEIRIRKYK